MQGPAKWRQNVLPTLNWRLTCLKCFKCVCANTCWEEEEEVPLGTCPFALILIQLHTSCSSLPPPPLSLLLSRPVRPINKTLKLPEVSIYLPPPSSSSLHPPPPPSSCFGKNRTLFCITRQKKKYNRKGLRNKRSIKVPRYLFHLHISTHALFFLDQAGKKCCTNTETQSSWQWHELFKTLASSVGKKHNKRVH